jgi:hypothetical protein
MRGRPAHAGTAPLLRRDGLSKRIQMWPGVRIEFEWPYGWTVTMPTGRRSGAPPWIGGLGMRWMAYPGHEIREAFGGIEVDAIALDDVLTRLARVQGLVLPEWPTERQRRKPGRRQNPWKQELHGIWEVRGESGRGPPGPVAEARALLERLKERHPGGKHFPALGTVKGWIAARFR